MLLSLDIKKNLREGTYKIAIWTPKTSVLIDFKL